jgi:hypothetical protein
VFRPKASIGARVATRAYSPADVTRAVKAVEKAGLCVARIKFTSESFEVVAGQPEEKEDASWFKDSPLYRSKAA